MHIGLIHYRLGLKGGLETRLYNYVREFQARGHQISVICASRNPRIQLPKEVEVIQWAPGWYPKLFHLRQWKFSQHVKQRLPFLSLEATLSLGRTAGEHHILGAGNHWGYVKALGKKRLRLDDRMQIRLDQESFDRSPAIIAASQMMVEEISQYYQVSKEKLSVLYPPLNTDRFHWGWRKDRQAIRSDLGLESDKLHFLFLSTSHARKGYALLHQVFSQLPPERYQLWVVGDKKPGGYPALPQIRFVGFSQQTERWLTAVDALVHPALYEPFGQVVSEALACGTPVMISTCTGAKELLGPSEGLVLPPNEPQQWVEALRRFSPQSFRPNQDFVDKHHLSVANHVEKLLAHWQDD